MSDKSELSTSKKRSLIEAELKPVNFDNLSNSLWLVKLPQMVAKKWATASQDEILGNLMFGAFPSKDGGPPQKQFRIQLNNEDNDETLVESFTLDENKLSSDTMIAFKTAENTKELSIDGKITKNLNMKPLETAQYRALMKQRADKAHTRKVIKVLTDAEAQMSRIRDHQLEIIELIPENSQHLTAILGEELRLEILKALQEVDSYTLSNMRDKLKSLNKTAKDADIKYYFEKLAQPLTGSFKNQWKLKPEYKTS